MSSETILDRILAAKREEVLRQKKLVPQRFLEARIREESTQRPFREQLRRDHVTVIAEMKQASPSKGVLVEDFDPVHIAHTYDRGGAAAISVLTDEPFFGGSLSFLPQVKDACSQPLLRKDFIIDPYQVFEAKAWRADAILLIVAALNDSQIKDLLQLAEELQLDALVEVHTGEELERALACDATLVGINNRDLHRFETRLETTLSLAARVPDHVVLISESGIFSAADVEHVAQCGVDGVLVGESLMRHPTPEQLLTELRSVPRRKRAARGAGEGTDLGRSLTDESISSAVQRRNVTP